MIIEIEEEKEIERRGDSISKITFGITREETKKIYLLRLQFQKQEIKHIFLIK